MRDKVKAPGGKAEGAGGVEVGESRDDDPADGDQHPGQEQLRHPADAGDFAVEQNHGEDDNTDGNKRSARHQPAHLQRSQQRDMQFP